MKARRVRRTVGFLLGEGGSRTFEWRCKEGRDPKKIKSSSRRQTNPRLIPPEPAPSPPPPPFSFDFGVSLAMPEVCGVDGSDGFLSFDVFVGDLGDSDVG
jgi:hypothetical protein